MSEAPASVSPAKRMQHVDVLLTNDQIYIPTLLKKLLILFGLCPFITIRIVWKHSMPITAEAQSKLT